MAGILLRAERFVNPGGTNLLVPERLNNPEPPVAGTGTLLLVAGRTLAISISLPLATGLRLRLAGGKVAGRGAPAVARRLAGRFFKITGEVQIGGTSSESPVW